MHAVLLTHDYLPKDYLKVAGYLRMRRCIFAEHKSLGCNLPSSFCKASVRCHYLSPAEVHSSAICLLDLILLLACPPYSPSYSLVVIDPAVINALSL